MSTMTQDFVTVPNSSGTLVKKKTGMLKPGETTSLQDITSTTTEWQKETDESKEVALRLLDILSDLYVLRLKTEQVHWNVEGPWFHSVHALTESMYKTLSEAIDEVAERIRARGFYVPATFKTYQTLSVLEFEQEAQSAENMLQHLAHDREEVAARLKSAIEMAHERNDEVTADLLTTIWHRQEKYAWMMHSILGGQSERLL